MPFGAKTVANVIADIEQGGCGETLDITGNASLRMKPAEHLAEIIAVLKGNQTIKKLVLVDCELPDDACVPLEELFRTNHTLEEVVLEKNKMSSHGAKLIAQGLAENRGIRTINLLQQAVKSFGDDCLDAFVVMYGTNITLTKLTWRLDSRKSFMLAKLQTRNIEIQKRITNGREYNDLLPDNLKSGAPVPAVDAPTSRPSVKEVEVHAEAISQHLPEESEAPAEDAAVAPVDDAPAEAVAEASAETAAEAAPVPE